MSWQTHAPVHFCTCICRLKRSYQQIFRSLKFRSKLIHLPPTKLADELIYVLMEICMATWYFPC